jgi:elongation factor 3
VLQYKPEARTYYELSASVLKFNFPQPGFLDGITSDEKPILRASKVRQGMYQ